jgi:hypothetical protein
MTAPPNCAWCDLPGMWAEMIPSVERGPDGQPLPVFVHDTCLEAWGDRTDPLGTDVNSKERP